MGSLRSPWFSNSWTKVKILIYSVPSTMPLLGDNLEDCDSKWWRWRPKSNYRHEIRPLPVVTTAPIYNLVLLDHGLFLCNREHLLVLSRRRLKSGHLAARQGVICDWYDAPLAKLPSARPTKTQLKLVYLTRPWLYVVDVWYKIII